MKQLAAKSNKTPLIWLVSFALLFNFGVGTESSSTSSLRNVKQTELALSTSDRKVRKRSHFVKVFFGQPISYFLLRPSFPSLISNQTEEAELRQKLSEDHLISRLPKIGHVHGKITENDDDSFLKG